MWVVGLFKLSKFNIAGFPVSEWLMKLLPSWSLYRVEKTLYQSITFFNVASMNDNLITIATFGNVIDAQLALGKLESAGVKAVLFDENVGNLFNVLVGGIKLKIREVDKEEAIRILNEQDDNL